MIFFHHVGDNIQLLVRISSSVSPQPAGFR